ncbi:unnamed protein product [Clonostachys chloroleuca]|uniref:Uncharacterized protein n=1 Tax=Clonostachys chloroleuca TaxID=1926264 RepID=A0AA35MBX6_9HYPO|nr:unnamed protein product [Clonostachys chloroleuca]
MPSAGEGTSTEGGKEPESGPASKAKGSHHKADEEEDDDDDNSLDETLSNFSSVSEDSLPPIHAFGFTYHGSGRILWPNDEAGGRVMDLQHHLWKSCLGGNLTDTRLPIEKPNFAEPSFHILDVGTGTGIWAIEMALRYPQATILGMDISSSLLPKDVPSNLTFEVADITEEPWPPRLYDFIHMRNICQGGISDWQALITNAYNHLRPGGHLEFTLYKPRFFGVDPAQTDLPSGELAEIGPACRLYETLLTTMTEALGLDYDPMSRIVGWLGDLGGENIRERTYWVPLHSPRDVVMRERSELMRQVFLHGMDQFNLMLFDRNGWSESDTRDLIDQVNKEVQDPKLRSSVRLAFITAKKPPVPRSAAGSSDD